ncbi:unnamed protein product, partial [Durusdinium trenchii]
MASELPPSKRARVALPSSAPGVYAQQALCHAPSPPRPSSAPCASAASPEEPEPCIALGSEDADYRRRAFTLTRVLRTGRGLDLAADATVDIGALLRHGALSGLTLSGLTRLAQEDNKGRFHICGTRIRACQGHMRCLAGVLQDEFYLQRIALASQLQLCVHYTSARSWPRIRAEGVRPMDRIHSHWCSVDSGPRRGTDVAIYLDVERPVPIDIGPALLAASLAYGWSPAVAGSAPRGPAAPRPASWRPWRAQSAS